MINTINNLIDFYFKALFLFWILLVVLELFMPGFAVYYINLNLLFVIVIILGVKNLFINNNNKKI